MYEKNDISWTVGCSRFVDGLRRVYVYEAAFNEEHETRIVYIF